MNRRSLLFVIALVVAGVMITAPAVARPPWGHAKAPVTYLSLGTSLAAGVQADPLTGESVVTEVSYPGFLAQYIGQDITNLRHVNLGCPGENSDTFIDGGICDYRHGSQLQEAVWFLRKHRKSVGLITIDLGANDALRCVNLPVIDEACLNDTIYQLADNLAYALKKLRKAAGPDVPIVGMNYYNPLLVVYPQSSDLAILSAILQSQLNGTLFGVYVSFGVPMADVAAAFDSNNFTVPQGGFIPVNMQLICALTWMCVGTPPFMNIHPNEAGYRLIAEEFVKVLPPIHEARPRWWH